MFTPKTNPSDIGENATEMADASYVSADGGLTGRAPSTPTPSIKFPDKTPCAFAKSTSIPCFVAGSRVATTHGLVPVELIEPGMLVITRDHGLQPVRWIGQSRRLGQGKYAPIEIAAGTFGDHGRTRVSRSHRLLVTGANPQILFGETEVLARARDLINGHSVRVARDSEHVVYVHLLFDSHEVIWADGLQSESYQPRDENFGAFDPRSREEVLNRMPNLRGGGSYGPAARRSLRTFEAMALSSQFANKHAAG